MRYILFNILSIFTSKDTYLILLFMKIFLLFPNIIKADINENALLYNLQTKKNIASGNYNSQNLSNYAKLQLSKKYNSISGQLGLNFSKNRVLNLDQSYIKFNHKNSNIGFGKINRNWSFSKRSSLILSSNARPSTSIFFIHKNDNVKRGFALPSPRSWSFEAFNSVLSNSNGPDNTLLLGMRATIQPVNNLKFEIIKTSQWGGVGYKRDFDAFAAAFAGNTNEKKNANINQMAGFGFSLLTNTNQMPIRIYGQFIGEDESGNLPSCYMKLVGSELELPIRNLPTTLGIEFIDTTIDFTSKGNCGPNTAYNNNTYSYTNHNISMGSSLDTEGQSIGLWGSTKLSENLDVKYSIDKLIINNNNWQNHRLSTVREKGFIASVETIWNNPSFFLISKINYQGLLANKTNTQKGVGFNFNVQHNF
jgi:hypothetical protein